MGVNLFQYKTKWHCGNVAEIALRGYGSLPSSLRLSWLELRARPVRGNGCKQSVLLQGLRWPPAFLRPPPESYELI